MSSVPERFVLHVLACVAVRQPGCSFKAILQLPHFVVWVDLIYIRKGAVCTGSVQNHCPASASESDGPRSGSLVTV